MLKQVKLNFLNKYFIANIKLLIKEYYFFKTIDNYLLSDTIIICEIIINIVIYSNSRNARLFF